LIGAILAGKMKGNWRRKKGKGKYGVGDSPVGAIFFFPKKMLLF
jgi:hypothetical protein